MFSRLDDKIHYRDFMSYSKSMETIVAFVDSVAISSMDEFSKKSLIQGFKEAVKQFGEGQVEAVAQFSPAATLRAAQWRSQQSGAAEHAASSCAHCYSEAQARTC